MQCSVVCITYNHSQFSKSSLESVIALKDLCFEVIVVDDGSTDGNQQIIKSALEHTAVRHTLIFQENSGNVAKNINIGLSKANAEYVIILSLDDKLKPEKIKEKLNILEADNNIVFVASSTNDVIDEKDQIISRNKPNPLFGYERESAAQLLEIEYQNIGTYLVQGSVFRRDFLLQIGGMDQDLVGDDINLRTKIWKFLKLDPTKRHVIINSPGVCYRIHKNNLHKNEERQIETILQWHNRFFPERKLPLKVEQRMKKFIEQCLKNNNVEKLDELEKQSKEFLRVKREYLRSLRFFLIKLFKFCKVKRN